MLTRPQQILLKRAQHQARVDDAEYREMLHHYCDVNSSTDPRMSDDHLDVMLAYLEAIYWRGVDAGDLLPPVNAREVFFQRGYWASKNRRGNTSRDRYHEDEMRAEIARLEQHLSDEFGYGFRYFQAIQNKVRGLVNYKAALARTLASKRRKSAEPF